MKFNKLLIIDNSLRDAAGHHFEYAKSVSDAATKRGLECVVLSNRRVQSAIRTGWIVVPAFRFDQYYRLIHTKYFRQIVASINLLFSSINFFYDLRSAIRPLEVDDRSLLFIPNADEPVLYGVMRWWKAQNLAKRPRIVFLFRYEPSEYVFRVAIASIHDFVREEQVCLATDSELLAKKYNEITGMDFRVLPIPHTEFSTSGATLPASSGRPIQFIFPGNARLEKGIDTLANAIPLLESELMKGKISLRIQCNLAMADRWVTAVVGTLELLQTKYPGISLLRNTLSQNEYRDFLSGADAVIIPYKRQMYSRRTSGPCAEALSLGKPVIVPEETWMSIQAIRYGGAMVFRNDDENDLARAIVTVTENFQEFSRKAKENSSSWRLRHNPNQFCQELLSCPS